MSDTSPIGECPLLPTNLRCGSVTTPPPPLIALIIVPKVVFSGPVEVARQQLLLVFRDEEGCQAILKELRVEAIRPKKM